MAESGGPLGQNWEDGMEKTNFFCVWGCDFTLTAHKEQEGMGCSAVTSISRAGPAYCKPKLQSRKTVGISRQCRWCSVSAWIFLKSTTKTDITCISKMHSSKYICSTVGRRNQFRMKLWTSSPWTSAKHPISTETIPTSSKGERSIWILSSYVRGSFFFHKCFLVRPVVNAGWPPQVSQPEDSSFCLYWLLTFSLHSYFPGNVRVHCSLLPAFLLS